MVGVVVDQIWPWLWTGAEAKGKVRPGRPGKITQDQHLPPTVSHCQAWKAAPERGQKDLPWPPSPRASRGGPTRSGRAVRQVHLPESGGNTCRKRSRPRLLDSFARM